MRYTQATAVLVAALICPALAENETTTDAPTTNAPSETPAVATSAPITMSPVPPTSSPTLPTICLEHYAGSTTTTSDLEAWANCCYRNNYANCPEAHCEASLGCDLMASLDTFEENGLLDQCLECAVKRVAEVAGDDFFVVGKRDPCSGHEDKGLGSEWPSWPSYVSAACVMIEAAIKALPDDVKALVEGTRWLSDPPPPANLAQLVIEAAGGNLSLVDDYDGVPTFASNLFSPAQYQHLFGMWETFLGVDFDAVGFGPEVALLRQAAFANATDDLVRRAMVGIKTHAIGSLFSLKTNVFSVFTEAERVSLFGGFIEDPSLYENVEEDRGGETLRRRRLDQTDWPEIDYRNASKNPAGVVAVTAVKNQVSCGSCWSFATTGLLEGKMAIENGVLISLSEQHIVSCDVAGSDNGCQGGHYYHALKYTADNGATVSSEEPYRNVDTRACPAGKHIVMKNEKKGGGVAVGQAKTEAALISALNVGPVAVAVRSSHPAFGSYSGGILNDPECLGAGDMVDHAVLAVGYGTDEELGLDYWTIKNSWGFNWGEHGYIRLARGTEFGARDMGMCGILTSAMYPLSTECISDEDPTCASLNNSKFCTAVSGETICYGTSFNPLAYDGDTELDICTRLHCAVCDETCGAGEGETSMLTIAIIAAACIAGIALLAFVLHRGGFIESRGGDGGGQRAGGVSEVAAAEMAAELTKITSTSPTSISSESSSGESKLAAI